MCCIRLRVEEAKHVGEHTFATCMEDENIEVYPASYRRSMPDEHDEKEIPSKSRSTYFEFSPLAVHPYSPSVDDPSLNGLTLQENLFKIGTWPVKETRMSSMIALQTTTKKQQWKGANA